MKEKLLILIKKRYENGFSKIVGMYDGNIHTNDLTLFKMMQIALNTDVKWKHGKKKIPVDGDAGAWVRLKQKIHAPYWIKRAPLPEGIEFRYNDQDIVSNS